MRKGMPKLTTNNPEQLVCIAQLFPEINKTTQTNLLTLDDSEKNVSLFTLLREGPTFVQYFIDSEETPATSVFINDMLYVLINKIIIDIKGTESSNYFLYCDSLFKNKYGLKKESAIVDNTILGVYDYDNYTFPLVSSSTTSSTIIDGIYIPSVATYQKLREYIGTTYYNKWNSLYNSISYNNNYEPYNISTGESTHEESSINLTDERTYNDLNESYSDTETPDTVVTDTESYSNYSIENATVYDDYVETSATATAGNTKVTYNTGINAIYPANTTSAYNTDGSANGTSETTKIPGDTHSIEGGLTTTTTPKGETINTKTNTGTITNSGSKSTSGGYTNTKTGSAEDNNVNRTKNSTMVGSMGYQSYQQIVQTARENALMELLNIIMEDCANILCSYTFATPQELERIKYIKNI